MAVTVRYLPFRKSLSLSAWIKELAGWIGGVNAASTPLSWAVVEADDGNTRDVPSGGVTIDHLPGGNLWRTDSGSVPPLGSWIVLRSEPGVSPPNNQWELYFFLQTATRTVVRMLAANDFVTNPGGSAGGEPTLPNTASSMNYDYLANHAPAFFAVGDESCLIFGTCEPGELTPGSFVYVGEMDVPLEYGAEQGYDPYPFILRTIQDPRVATTDTPWVRRNAIDPTQQEGGASNGRDTVLALGNDTLVGNATESLSNPYRGSMMLFPFGVSFGNSSSGLVQGYVRHCWTYNPWNGVYGLTSGKRHLLLGGPLALTGIAITWDQTTGLP